jgi:hypothetical protein
MKSALKFSLFLFVIVLFADKSLSLTDFQIKKFCKKEKRQYTCIKNLQKKRFHLQEGDSIEIPVIPYKK